MKSWLTSIKASVVCVAILLATSCGQSGSSRPINGVEGPFFNVINGSVVLTIKLLKVNFDGGVRGPIPETRNSFVELGPNAEDGGMLLTLTLDSKDLESIDIGVGQGNTLPDGRPIPGIAGGELQNSLRVDVHNWHNMSFYFTKKLFGIWLPFGFDTAGWGGSTNVYMGQRNVGMIGLIGSDNNGNKAGGILFLRLGGLKDPQLQRLIKLSKLNPHRIY